MPTAAEITAQAHDAFKKYDTNGDGGLDKDEAREFFRHAVEAHGGAFDEDKFQTAFVKMDANGNGNISPEEAVAWLLSVAEAKGVLTH